VQFLLFPLGCAGEFVGSPLGFPFGALRGHIYRVMSLAVSIGRGLALVIDVPLHDRLTVALMEPSHAPAIMDRRSTLRHVGFPRLRVRPPSVMLINVTSVKKFVNHHNKSLFTLR
jgi:hypothetical protein